MGLISLLADDLERPVLHVGNNGRIVHFAANEPLCIENRVDRIHRGLVLCSISDQPLRFSESHPRRGSAISLIIRNDFNSLILPDSHAGICRAQIDTDRRSIHFLQTNKNRTSDPDDSSSECQEIILSPFQTCLVCKVLQGHLSFLFEFQLVAPLQCTRFPARTAAADGTVP